MATIPADLQTVIDQLRDEAEATGYDPESAPARAYKLVMEQVEVYSEYIDGAAEYRRVGNEDRAAYYERLAEPVARMIRGFRR